MSEDIHGFLLINEYGGKLTRNGNWGVRDHDGWVFTPEKAQRALAYFAQFNVELRPVYFQSAHWDAALDETIIDGEIEVIT